MDPAVVVLTIPIVAILCSTVLKVMRLRAEREKSALPADLRERFQALENDVRALQQDLEETHERLDFTERLLSKAREEKRLT